MFYRLTKDTSLLESNDEEAVFSPATKFTYLYKEPDGVIAISKNDNATYLLDGNKPIFEMTIDVAGTNDFLFGRRERLADLRKVLDTNDGETQISEGLDNKAYPYSLAPHNYPRFDRIKVCGTWKFLSTVENNLRQTESVNSDLGKSTTSNPSSHTLAPARVAPNYATFPPAPSQVDRGTLDPESFSELSKLAEKNPINFHHEPDESTCVSRCSIL